MSSLPSSYAFDHCAAQIWAALEGAQDALHRLEMRGQGALASVFPVSDLAAASLGVAGLAISELVAQCGAAAPQVTDLLEAADAFGSSTWQKLHQVQLPMALPTIMGGVNQTIMLALSMVVVASMIGVQGLGQPVLRAITNQYFAMGLLNGLAIVVIAIVFDRVSQAYGLRLQKNREGTHA